jgi:iron complex transport system substrate-binding protein
MATRPSPRIVSLVPNGTEILFAVGAGSLVVGVTHECDYPPAARGLPVLTASALLSGLSAAEIDQAVSGQLASGESLYTLDEARIAELAPDVIVTQRLCPVCAVSTEQVKGAVASLPICPDLVFLDPHTLGDIWSDIERVGQLTGKIAEARALRASLTARVDAVRRAVAHREPVRVLALEWLDPPFGVGHWVPEMIEIAGGRDVLAQGRGETSARITWERVLAAAPDVVLAMPCGFDEAGARCQIERMAQRSEWQALERLCSGRIFPLDANGCFSRPGPRLVDGIERLADLLHPGARGAAPTGSGTTPEPAP